jgi:hypothetical protein
VNSTVKEDGEYVCIKKECGDRTPFSNGSCSMWEDKEEEACYYLGLERTDSDSEDVSGMCVEEGDCPYGYPGVCECAYVSVCVFM